MTIVHLLISHAFANGGPVELAEPSLTGGVVLKQATSVFDFRKVEDQGD